jgi:dihydroneopterin aldolase
LTESAQGAGGFDWRNAGDHVRVLLSDVAVDVRIGLHPWERHPERPTRLIVNVEMFAAWPLAKTGADGGFIDYDRVRDHIAGWRDRDHVELLETLVEELIGICFALPPVEACRVRITKPDIFPEAAAAGVEIFRRRPG